MDLRRVVDQDVDGANGFHQLVDLVQIGQVGRDRDGAATGGGDPLDDLGEQVLAAGDRDHRRAFGGEQLRGHGADARRRAGQQDPLAAEIDRGARRPARQRTHPGQPHGPLELGDHGATTANALSRVIQLSDPPRWLLLEDSR